MKSARNVSLITNINLDQSLRARDIIRPLHHMHSWHEQR
jgi:hypothetical protein